MKHSKEQQIAIDHVDGPMMVLAGPGAGKTTVITHRVKKLIEKEGVNPAQILVVTFSKAAAVEMRERFEKITDGRRLPVRFGTFHSLFFQVLRNAYHYEAKDILSQRLKYRFLEEALMETEYDDIEDRSEFLKRSKKRSAESRARALKSKIIIRRAARRRYSGRFMKDIKAGCRKTIIWILMTWFVIPTNCFVQGRIYWLAGRNDSGTF